MTKEELVRIIGELGLSRTELSEKMGVTTRTVNNWCSGKTMPAVNELALRYLMVEKGLGKSAPSDCSVYLQMLAERDAKIRELEHKLLSLSKLQ